MNDETKTHVAPELAIDANAPLSIGSIRWRICALLFFANTINYMDRQVLSFLAPLLQVKIGWTEAQYSYIVVAFQAAYALGLLFVGGFILRHISLLSWTG